MEVETMRALRLYGERDLRYETVPEPSPGPGQVKIKINLAGICGTDLKEYTSRSGVIATRKGALIPGHEFAGVVVEVGEGINSLKVGERVTGLGYRICGECFYCKKGYYNLCMNSDFAGITVDGCMAEYMIAPEYSLYRLPESVSDEDGVLVEPLAVAIHAVLQGKVHAGDTVAIVGDGTIGLCTLIIARSVGASKVFVLSRHGGRGTVALDFGATVIGPGDNAPVELIKDQTDGLGVDVAFECAGHPDTPQLTVDLARRGGTAVIMGVFDQPASVHFGTVMLEQKTIIGSPIYIDEAKTAIALMADGRIGPGKLITSKVCLEDAVKLGFEKLIADKEHDIKIVLRIT
jgi:(R,R)-butanediol dehydrogenase/meso-butanediol dehydrogenase/diacetyl reductase